ELTPTTKTYAIGPSGCGPITFGIASCQVRIPAQTGLLGSYSNLPEGKVEFRSTTTGLTYSTGTIGCSGGAVKSASTGVLQGSWILTGKAGRALAVSGATAHGLIAESYPVSLSGDSGVGKMFTLEAGTVECSQVTSSGVAAREASTITLAPTFA